MTGLRSLRYAHTPTETADCVRVVTICHVLREDPELADGLGPKQRSRAVEECVARTVHLPRGPWSNPAATSTVDGIGLLVLDGLLIRRVGIDGRFGAELLGEGDLLRPWPGDRAEPSLARTTGWRVLQPTRLALLDRAAEYRFAAHPELIGALVERALERSRNLSVNMAIVHQARVMVRLHMLFWHLADRWGRVGPEGVILPLALTHAVLADLVAARRPTVTSAMTELARRGHVGSHGEGWLLHGNPPGELIELQQVA
jgi:CRP/FNR family transcriptional regulator, cyclic AMP receptor protein